MCLFSSSLHVSPGFRLTLGIDLISPPSERLISVFLPFVSFFFSPWRCPQLENSPPTELCLLSVFMSEKASKNSIEQLVSVNPPTVSRALSRGLDEKTFFLLVLFFALLWMLLDVSFRWWAWTLIKGLSPEETLQVRAKVASLEALKGQRADLGLQRAWEGNYVVSRWWRTVKQIHRKRQIIFNATHTLHFKINAILLIDILVCVLFIYLFYILLFFCFFNALIGLQFSFVVHVIMTIVIILIIHML